MSQEDPDDYFLPLEDQRVFGAGYRRKRVKFVPAKDTTAGSSVHELSSRAASAPPQPQLSVGDRYLSLVLGDGESKKETAQTDELRQETYEGRFPTTRQASDSTRPSPGLAGVERIPASAHEKVVESSSGRLPNGYSGSSSDSQSNGVLCNVCNRVIPDTSVPSIRQHEASFVHQVSLPHSHPPSAIDRSRTGYRYLQSHGWDPDSRLGLGSAGQGILEPIKTRAKKDTVGLGIDIEKLKKEGKAVKKTEKKLNAKEVRQMEQAGKKKDERLRRMFYANEDVEKYLGRQGD